MAFSELSVHRALQPWRSAGLVRWLCEDDAHVQAIRTPKSQRASVAQGAPVAQRASVPQGSPVSQPRQAVGGGASSVQASVSGAARPEAAASPAAMTPSSPRNAASSTAQAVPPMQPEADAACAACIRAVGDWPDAWRDLLNRSPQAVGGRRARIVWSYPALGDDYGGRADAARRAMLQQLLRDLSLPAGSHAFWPQTPPPYDVPGAEPDAAFFHSGIAALNPSVVVLFGEVSPLLRLPALSLLVPEMVLGRSMVRVQSIETLSAPFASAATGGRLPHLALVQFLRSQFGALFIT